MYPLSLLSLFYKYYFSQKRQIYTFSAIKSNKGLKIFTVFVIVKNKKAKRG